MPVNVMITAAHIPVPHGDQRPKYATFGFERRAIVRRTAVRRSCVQMIVHFHISTLIMFDLGRYGFNYIHSNSLASVHTNFMAARRQLMRPTAKKMRSLIVASDDTLLVVARGLIVGIDDGVRSHTVGVVRLSPGVDGVDVRDILEHGGAEEGEHSASYEQRVKKTLRIYQNMKRMTLCDNIKKSLILISNLQFE